MPSTRKDGMALKIGELARRTGLTVRALRHYDDIGLLVPSERSGAGYRLYSQADVARLYRIQALRRMDLPLADIRAMLDDAAGDIAEVVARQIGQLDRGIEQATALRGHLAAMQTRLRTDHEPDLGDWLVALESMVVGTQYFSADEQRALHAPREGSDQSVAPERTDLQSRLHRLVAAGKPPESPEAQALAQRWIELLLEDTQGDEALLMKLYTMHSNETSLHALTGVDPVRIRYISHAMAFARLQRYAPHCTAAEMATLREHYVAQTDAWPPLIGDVRQQMAAGTPAQSPAMRTLAVRWQALSLAKTGGDRALQAKLQRAFDNDASLRSGSGIDQALAAYMAQAVAHLDGPSAS